MPATQQPFRDKFEKRIKELLGQPAMPPEEMLKLMRHAEVRPEIDIEKGFHTLQQACKQAETKK